MVKILKLRFSWDLKLKFKIFTLKFGPDFVAKDWSSFWARSLEILKLKFGIILLISASQLQMVESPIFPCSLFLLDALASLDFKLSVGDWYFFTAFASMGLSDFFTLKLFPLYHIFNLTIHKFSKGHFTCSFSSPLWPHHMIIIISWFDDYHIMISSHFHYIHLLTISTTLTKYFKDIMLFLHYSIIDVRSRTLVFFS